MIKAYHMRFWRKIVKIIFFKAWTKSYQKVLIIAISAPDAICKKNSVDFLYSSYLFNNSLINHFMSRLIDHIMGALGTMLSCILAPCIFHVCWLLIFQSFLGFLVSPIYILQPVSSDLVYGPLLKISYSYVFSSPSFWAFLSWPHKQSPGSFLFSQLTFLLFFHVLFLSYISLTVLWTALPILLWGCTISYFLAADLYLDLEWHLGWEFSPSYRARWRDYKIGGLSFHSLVAVTLWSSFCFCFLDIIIFIIIIVALGSIFVLVNTTIILVAAVHIIILSVIPTVASHLCFCWSLMIKHLSLHNVSQLFLKQPANSSQQTFPSPTANLLKLMSSNYILPEKLVRLVGLNVPWVSPHIRAYVS